MSDLTNKVTNIALNKTWEMYLLAQHFHWNVVGHEFPYMHSFYGDIYDELYGTIDPFAENIRKIGGFPLLQPASANTSTDITSQLVKLLEKNDEVIEVLYTAYDALERERELGFSNFIQDRLDAHAKHKWMIKSTMGKM